MIQPATSLFPEIEPYATHRLQVSDLHTLYVEECGNPQGRPVVFLHGGPGGGISPAHRRFFNPKKWRIILFDQRGCGKSTPHAELRENTTWDLVADMERIRTKLNIKTWTVFGGSWGSTLALSYAITHPAKCEFLALRGIFLITKREIDWFYRAGAHQIFPDAWEPYAEQVKDVSPDRYVEKYYELLQSPDRLVRMNAAKAWSVWEASTSQMIPNPDWIKDAGADTFAEAFARIECHYFINKGFFSSDNFLLDSVEKIKDIPGVIVHGRYDCVCPVKAAWDLHNVWKKSTLHIIPDAGHSVKELGIEAALVACMEKI